jgi:hypothetical protein
MSRDALTDEVTAYSFKVEFMGKVEVFSHLFDAYGGF